jgi:hypothetical protein
MSGKVRFSSFLDLPISASSGEPREQQSLGGIQVASLVNPGRMACCLQGANPLPWELRFVCGTRPSNPWRSVHACSRLVLALAAAGQARVSKHIEVGLARVNVLPYASLALNPSAWKPIRSR